jgi:hypothetical protein
MDGRGLQIGVAQHHLDTAKIGAGFEEVGQPCRPNHFQRLQRALGKKPAPVPFCTINAVAR